MHVITRPERATPEWLTEVLRRCGMLDDAQVTSLSAELVLDYNSQIFRLTPIYSVADHHCPPTLILKLKEGGGARDELAVAHAFEPHGRQLPMFVRWYDAAYSPEQDAGHFLMAD